MLVVHWYFWNFPQGKHFIATDSHFARNRRQVKRNQACSNCRSAKEEDKVNDSV